MVINSVGRGSEPHPGQSFLCPCVGTFPLLRPTLRRDKLGISKHCHLPLNYLDLVVYAFNIEGTSRNELHIFILPHSCPIILRKFSSSGLNLHLIAALFPESTPLRPHGKA